MAQVDTLDEIDSTYRQAKVSLQLGYHFQARSQKLGLAEIVSTQTKRMVSMLSVRPLLRRMPLICLASVFLFCVALCSLTLLAQTTISTGSIQGLVTDPSGAVVSGAKIAISNKATGRVIITKSTSAGAYTSGALTPGEYTLRVEAQGFKTSEIAVTVQVGVTASGNVKLQVGQETQVVVVQGAQVAVNTQQATVQGVLTAEQIENLPINGRNFLDLAQLEPGVQIQDGGNFDPTKNGFSSISFGGRFGRTARIEVDGLDISDETVGTTTQNVPASGIQEFQIQQSSLDLSTELTSSGSVNVTTKSGTNKYHGEGYYAFRDQTLDANLPGGSDNPFQRNQYGGNFGGPILKGQAVFLPGCRADQTGSAQSGPAGRSIFRAHRQLQLALPRGGRHRTHRLADQQQLQVFLSLLLRSKSQRAGHHPQ
jgi:hypothetical protein